MRRHACAALVGIVLLSGCGNDPDPNEPTPRTPVASVTLNHEDDTVVVRSVLQLAATLRDSNGTELEDRVVQWLTSDGLLATVEEGRVQTKAPGVVTITALAEGKRDSVRLTLAANVAVSRRLPTTFAGDTTRLFAALTDAEGQPIDVGTEIWSSSDKSVAMVAPDGIVTGVSPGRATIMASSFGNSGSVELVVLDPTPRPNRELTYTRYSAFSELHRIGVDGTGDETLTDIEREFGSHQWSPDGNRLAVTYYPLAGEGTAPLYTMNADGSDQRELQRDSVYRPRWSPDGSRLVFERGVWPGRIYVINADGTGLRELTTVEGNQRAPEWSPDGRRIGFRADTFPPDRHSTTCGDFWLVDADGSHAENVDLPTNVCYHEWSPDGKLIAFDSGQNPEFDGIWLINSDGTNPRPFTSNCSMEGFCSGPRGYRQPRWSPDGKRLAYASWSLTSFEVEGDPFRIHVSNIAQTQMIDFPVGSATGYGAEWSPDGTLLAYAIRAEPVLLPTLVVSQPDGSGQVPVVTTQPAGGLTWRR
jgi:Tol biopolymer transport system component